MRPGPGSPAEHQRRARSPGRRPRDVLLAGIVGAVVGSVPEKTPSRDPHGVVGVGAVDPARSGRRGVEAAPRRAAAVHHVEHLGRRRRRPAGVEVGVDGAGRQLGVEPVDQRLVRLPPVGEADGLLRRPRPGRRRPGRPPRARRSGAADASSKKSSSPAGVRRRARSRVVGGPSGRRVDDRGPEPLHLGEVPQQVVGVPVGAGRHPARGSQPASTARKRADSVRRWSR